MLLPFLIQPQGHNPDTELTAVGVSEHPANALPPAFPGISAFEKELQWKMEYTLQDQATATAFGEMPLKE